MTKGKTIEDLKARIDWDAFPILSKTLRTGDIRLWEEILKLHDILKIVEKASVRPPAVPLTNICFTCKGSGRVAGS